MEMKKEDNFDQIERLDRQYKSMVKGIETLTDKKTFLRRLNSIERWYNRKKKIINRRYERSIKAQIFLSNIRLFFGRLQLRITKNDFDMNNKLDQFNPFFTFIPRLIFWLFNFIARILLNFFHIIIIPFSFFAQKIPYYYITLVNYLVNRLAYGKKSIEKYSTYNEIDHPKLQLDPFFSLPLKDIAHEFILLDKDSKISAAIPIVRDEKKALLLDQNGIWRMFDQDALIRQDIKVDFMHKPIKDIAFELKCFDYTQKLSEAIDSIVTNKCIIVKYDDKFLCVTTDDVLEYINKFFENFEIKTVGLKRAIDIAAIPQFINSNERLLTARTMMDNSKTNILMVKKGSFFVGKFKGQPAKGGPGEIIGTFSWKDYANELDKGIERIRTFHVENCMQPNFVSLVGSEDLLMINSLILEFDELVVGEKKHIIGYIDKQVLLSELIKFIRVYAHEPKG